MNALAKILGVIRDIGVIDIEEIQKDEKLFNEAHEMGKIIWIFRKDDRG